LKSSVSSAVSYVSSKVSGKHRNGLREVPYDDYLAQLHRGEMVLTAAEAIRYRKSMENPQTTNNNTINFNGNYSFNNQKDIDYFMTEAGKLIKRKVG
jgi:hypothetical protein